MIEVRGLTKFYGPHRAVDNLSFKVNKGEVVGFLGPNGAGKTTTMKIITGFMAPSTGEAKVSGFDVYEHPMEVKKRIGYLPETPPLYGDMTVEEYLTFVARLKKVEKAKVANSVERAIKKTDLGSVRYRLIQNLSKGFRQRVGISQAIVSDPEVLILDEPTVGLDPRQVAEVRDLIKSLAGEHTIILSTHILPEVQAVCQRIIIINKGKIVIEDTMTGLAQRMSGGTQVHIQVQKHDAALLKAISAIAGVTAVSEVDPMILRVTTDGSAAIRPKLAEVVVKQSAGLMELWEENVDLEDIFLKATSDTGRVGGNGRAQHQTASL